MYVGLLHAHSGLRYVVLFLMIAVLAKSLDGWLQRKPFTGLDDKLSLFFFISVHLQLLVGLILYFVSPRVRFDGLSDPMSRYWTVEHISLNLLAVVLFTLARTRGKKMPLPEGKHRILFVFTALGTAVLLYSLIGFEYAPGLVSSSMGK